MFVPFFAADQFSKNLLKRVATTVIIRPAGVPCPDASLFMNTYQRSSSFL